MIKNKIELTPQQLDAFQNDGYIIVSGLLNTQELQDMQDLAISQLRQSSPPLEYEAQLGYPGAPISLTNQGGTTVRRLLTAYQRHITWAEWATNCQISRLLQQLFGEESICLSQSHHNCLMTKSPEHSSDTGWHQDIRYWSFEAPELISVWLALGTETTNNGGLVIIPGSHRENFSAEQFDDKKFFRTDLETNQLFIRRSKSIQLTPGDALFFHCRLLHSASRNYSSKTKYSLVFTYRKQDNKAIVGSRSDNQEDVKLDCPIPSCD